MWFAKVYGIIYITMNVWYEVRKNIGRRWQAFTRWASTLRWWWYICMRMLHAKRDNDWKWYFTDRGFIKIKTNIEYINTDGVQKGITKHKILLSFVIIFQRYKHKGTTYYCILMIVGWRAPTWVEMVSKKDWSILRVVVGSTQLTLGESSTHVTTYDGDETFPFFVASISSTISKCWRTWCGWTLSLIAGTHTHTHTPARSIIITIKKIRWIGFVGETIVAPLFIYCITSVRHIFILFAYAKHSKGSYHWICH